MKNEDMKLLHSAAVVPVPVAGRVLGLKSRNAAAAAALAGDIPTIKVGSRLVVPTAKLRELLGIKDQVAA